MKSEKNWSAEQLAGALGVKEAPASFHNRLRQVYAELPEELPARKRHGVWKSLCTAAASVAAAFLLLFSLNAVNPALAESLPGLGSLFSVINGAKNAMGGSLGTYEESLQKIGLTASSKDSPGYGLTVDEGYCDGEYLYVTMELSQPREAEQYDGVMISCDGKSDYTFLVDGREAEQVSSGGGVRDGARQWVSVWKLPEAAENGEEIPVSIRIGTLYGVYPNFKTERRFDEIPVDFDTLAFRLTVDTTQNTLQRLSAEDNGVKLFGLRRTPGFLLVDLELPFWGRESDSLTNTSPVLKGWWELTTEDGRELARNSKLTEIDVLNEDNADSVRGILGFDGAPKQEKRVILRLYENDPRDTSEEKPYLFAEFTIDLERGEAVPSKTYEAEGYTKIATEEYRSRKHHAEFTNGYFLMENYTTHDMWFDASKQCTAVSLYAESAEYRPLEMRFYRDGALLGTIASHPEEEYNEMLGDQWPAYRDDTGFFAMAPAGYPYSDGSYQEMLLFVYYYEDEARQNQYGQILPEETADGIELVDSETGETLLQAGEVPEGEQEVPSAG